MEQKQLELLHALILERERITKQLTQEIAEIIQPTVITAVLEVLEASPNQLEVISIEMYSDGAQAVEQNTMLVTSLLKYESESHIPALLNEISPLEFEGQDPLLRMVRVAIPFSYAFQDKEMIKEMLYKMLINSLEETDEISEFAAHLEELEHSPEPKSNVVSLLEYHEKLNKGKLH